MFSPHPSLARLDHRPYPLPGGAWALRQTWRDLLFAHWPITASELRAAGVPERLEIDEFDGTAWVGVVPFYMSGIAARGLPAVPGTGSFAELNLRTYVTPTGGGPAGVYFLTLEAANWLACRVARIAFSLPYRHAKMSYRRGQDGWVEYDSRRRDEPRGVGFAGRYRPTGEVFAAKPGTLDYFLTERYCLYVTGRRGRLRRGDIHHQPWPLRAAEWEVDRLDLPEAHGLSLPDVPARLLFSGQINVVVWLTRPVPDAR